MPLCPLVSIRRFRTHGCRGGVTEVIPNSPADPGLCTEGQGPGGSCGPNEVWSYGDEVQPVLERYIRLRNDVVAPYVQELARNVSARGVVTMRSLCGNFDIIFWTSSQPSPALHYPTRVRAA